MIDIPEGLHPVQTCAVRRVSQSWPFAEMHKNKIAQHWDERRRENSKFFNGRVFIMAEATLQEGHLQGCIIETDFANSLYWRETGFTDRSVVDCFAAAIILCADNTLIYGCQAPGHLNSGFAYPPCGFLDPRDVGTDGVADFAASAAREISEEIGFTSTDLHREPGFLAVRQGPYLCIGVTYRSPLTSPAFLDKVTAHLSREDDPELEGLAALRCKSDAELHPMRDFAKWIAQHVLAE